MIIASEPDIDLPLEKLCLRQKIDLFHHLRSELGFEISPEPQEWHLEILKKREEKFTSGEANLMELDDVIAEIRAKLT